MKLRKAIGWSLAGAFVLVFIITVIVMTGRIPFPMMRPLPISPVGTWVNGKDTIIINERREYTYSNRSFYGHRLCSAGTLEQHGPNSHQVISDSLLSDSIFNPHKPIQDIKKRLANGNDVYTIPREVLLSSQFPTQYKFVSLKNYAMAVWTESELRLQRTDSNWATVAIYHKIGAQTTH